MWKDTIVQEVRKAGEELARQVITCIPFFNNCEKTKRKASAKSLKE